MAIDVEDDELEGLTDEEKEARRKPIAPPIAPPPASRLPGGNEPSSFTANEGINESNAAIGAPIQPMQLQQPFAQRPAYERYEKLQGQDPWQTKKWSDLGTGGKIGRVAEGIGSAIVPGPVSMIPGTELNFQRKLGGAEKAAKAEESEITNKSEEELRSAQTEEQRALAQKNRNPQLQAGKTPEEQFMMDALHGGPNGGPKNDPEGKPYTYLSAHEAFVRAGDVKEPKTYNVAEELHKEHPDWPAEQIQAALQKDTNPIAGEVGNEQTFAVYDPRKGWVDTTPAHNPMRGFKPAPSKFPRVFPVNDAQGNTVGYNVIIGDTSEFMPVSRFGGPGSVIPPKPTSTTLTMSQMAKTIEPQIDRYKTEIDNVAGQMGPLRGRWNEFMTGKVGTDNPQFAGFLSDTDAMAVAIVRTHLGASGGEQYIADIKKSLRASQSPEDLKARIDAWNQWIGGYAAMTGGGGPAKAPPGGGGGGQGAMEWDAKAGKYVPKKKAQ